MNRRISRHLITLGVLAVLFIPFSRASDTPIILDERALQYTVLTRILLTAVVIMLTAAGTPADRKRRGWVRFNRIDLVLVPVVAGLTLLAGTVLPADVSYAVPSGNFRITGLLAASALLSAVLEECFFRSWMLSEYGRSDGFPFAAAAVSTLLFAVLHAWEGLPAVLFALFAGLLYSLLFVRRGNLPLLILAHGLHNALAIIIRFNR